MNRRQFLETSAALTLPMAFPKPGADIRQVRAVPSSPESYKSCGRHPSWPVNQYVAMRQATKPKGLHFALTSQAIDQYILWDISQKWDYQLQFNEYTLRPYTYRGDSAFVDAMHTRTGLVLLALLTHHRTTRNVTYRGTVTRNDIVRAVHKVQESSRGLVLAREMRLLMNPRTAGTIPPIDGIQVVVEDQDDGDERYTIPNGDMILVSRPGPLELQVANGPCLSTVVLLLRSEMEIHKDSSGITEECCAMIGCPASTMYIRKLS